MLFRNADIKGPLRIPTGKLCQPRTGRHSRRNGANPSVLGSQINHGLAERIGKAGGFDPKAFAGNGVKFSNAVEPGRILLRGRIAAALSGDYVDQDGLPHLFRGGQQSRNTRQIVTISGSQIRNAHVFEHISRHEHLLQPVFQAAGSLVNSCTTGYLFQNSPVITLGVQIILAASNLGKMPGQSAVAAADGHLIIVQDHHHGFLTDCQIVQRLVNHAAGGGAVAHQGDHIVVLPQQTSGPGHAQGDGNGTGSVTCHKGICNALSWLREAGNTAELPQTGKRLLTACQNLMDVGLMPHVKDQAVGSRIINRFNRYGKLNNA